MKTSHRSRRKWLGIPDPVGFGRHPASRNFPRHQLLSPKVEDEAGTLIGRATRHPLFRTIPRIFLPAYSLPGIVTDEKPPLKKTTFRRMEMRSHTLSALCALLVLAGSSASAFAQVEYARGLISSAITQ